MDAALNGMPGSAAGDISQEDLDKYDVMLLDAWQEVRSPGCPGGV